MQKREIIQYVCDKFKVKYDDIMSLRRDIATASAKRVIYYVFRLYGLSYQQIARAVNKEHTAILHSVKTMPEDLKSYAQAIYDRFSSSNMTIEEQRDMLIEYLNQGCKLEELMEKTKLCKDTIIEHVNYLIEHGCFKRIRNYKTNEVFYRYFKKPCKNNEIKM